VLRASAHPAEPLPLQPINHPMNVSLPSLRTRLLAGLLLIPALAASATTYVVNSIPALQAQINSAVAGDTIVVANGIYTTTAAITVNRAGAAGNPITIMAETISGVTIQGTHGFVFSGPAAYVTVEGFRFLHANSINIPSSTHHIRLLRNFIDLNIAAGADVSYVNISGDDVEIGYNELANKNTLGNMLDVTGSGSQVARRLWVHHNYFHDFVSPGGNGAETIRWGLSGLSLSTGNGLCEYNLFVRANGENEMISNKSSGNTYRFNTVLDSPGGEISQRHGDNCLYYGNYMKNTAGIRVYGDNHQIFSNYLEGNTKGIDMGNGDGDVHAGDPLTAHDRPDNNVVSFNTLINNNTHYQMGGRTGGLGAVNTTFAYNVIQGGTTAVSISTNGTYANPTWTGNIIWNPVNVGTIPASGYDLADPLLAPDANGILHLQAGSPAIGAAPGSFPAVTFDMDGQPRPNAVMDKGADEFSAATVTARILTPADVGPFASLTNPVPAIAPTFSPVPGNYTGSVAVTITSLSGGASIRYTTNGSDPTPTTGSVYSGPVTLAANTSLRAIAYGSGFTPSSVTTGDYTVIPAPPGPKPVVFEAETLAHVESGGSYSVTFEDTASGGAFASPNISNPADPLFPVRRRYVTFGADGVPPPPDGEWIEFALPAVPAGVYNLVLRYKSHPTNRGIMVLTVDGAQLGGTLDQRSSPATFLSRDFGQIRFNTAGDHVVRLTIVGKTGTGPWNLAPDVITLNPDTVAPVVAPIADQTLEASGPGGATATYTGSATDDKDGAVPVVFDPPSGSLFPLGTTVVVGLARDLTGNYGGTAFDITVVDTTPPVLTLPGNLVIEATGQQGAAVPFTATANDLVAGGVAVTFDREPGSVFPLGTTTVTATAADDFDNTATGTFNVTVRDTTSPDIQSVTPSRAELWPVNHKMVPITLTVVSRDAVDPAPLTRIVSVTSNEPVNGPGDGNTAADWEITGPLTLNLRAERSGIGSGRVYTITVESTDNTGNLSRTTTSVTVPHNR
jgi:poly(beta-D-mannuronate) lyase